MFKLIGAILDSLLAMVLVFIAILMLAGCSVTLEVTSPISDTEYDVIECNLNWDKLGFGLGEEGDVTEEAKWVECTHIMEK